MKILILMSTFSDLSESMGSEIVAQAPCRADLAGSTLDIWPLYLFHPGAVTVNIAVNVQTSCRITPRPDHEIHLHSRDTGHQERFASLDQLMAAKSYQHPLAAYLIRFFQPEDGFVLETHSKSPAGAGISGSSALMIATTAALARFAGHEVDFEQMRIIAQNVEAQLINVPTGCQDYYPAIYGGLNAVHLDADGIHCEPIPVALEEIDERFVLFYTGAPRQSGINNWEVFKAHINGDAHVRHNFAEIARIAQLMHRAVADEQWNDVEHLMREEWALRRTNVPGITTPLIDRLIDVACANGARAAKVCGAGGGGCVITLVEKGSRERVHKALRAHGGQPIDFRVAREGLTFHSALKTAAAQV